MIKIKIIAGSNRPGRFNIQPAEWIANIAKGRKDIEVELLDLEKINLPFLDEPSPAMMGKYTKDHTKAWAAQVGDADGFIFVTPEYNHSFSAVIKNAIDFLYAEWIFKPVGFIGYGAATGGASAIEQLRGVTGQLKMFDVGDRIHFPNYWAHLDTNGKYQFTEDQVKAANTLLDSVLFWADSMKEARAKLSA